MNILIINLESLSGNPVSAWLARHTCYLITTQRSKDAILTDGTSTYEKIIGIENSENSELIYYFAEELRRDVKFDYIIGVLESDLLPAAHLRNKWCLPGPSVEATLAYRDKGVMKTILKENGINVPEFSLVGNVLDLLGFIEKNQYPVLVKPRAGKRARGISVLNHDNDLYERLKARLQVSPDDMINVMVEEFVDGQIYHIDGMVIDGDIKFIWPSLYLTNCAGFPDGKYVASCLLAADDPLFVPLNKYVTDCINVLPSPGNFAFHAEVFECKDGSLKLCEIAARAGGGPIATALKNVFGINIKEIELKASIGEKDAISWNEMVIEPTQFCGWIIIPNKHSDAFVGNLPTDCPFDEVKNFNVYAKDGDYFGPERCVICEICIVGRTTEEVKSAIKKIMAWFDDTVNWRINDVEVKH